MDEFRSTRKRVPPSTLSIMSPPERALDQSNQLIGSPVDRMLNRRRLLGNRNGLPGFQASLHHATLVVLASLSAVLVAQMNLHPCNVIAHPVQGSFDHATDMIGQSLATFDVMVRIDLNLHIMLHCSRVKPGSS